MEVTETRVRFWCVESKRIVERNVPEVDIDYHYRFGVRRRHVASGSM